MDEQVYALNVVRADMDNDGDLDLALLRGGWEAPMRLSLLRNKGDATFEDVTLSAGLDLPIATEAACWGDFDNDGFADLFVCGAFLSPSGSANDKSDPRNRCRLYRNKGDGTFEDRAESLGVTGAERSFASWFWDYDNDGLLDLFVNDYSISLAATAAQALKLPSEPSTRPRLYKNLGDKGFRDVTSEVGLDRASSPMGCNFMTLSDCRYRSAGYPAGGLLVITPGQWIVNENRPRRNHHAAPGRSSSP